MPRSPTLSVITDFILGWILGLSLLFFLRGYGIPDFYPVRVTLVDKALIVLALGVLGGTLFGLIQLRSERYYERRLPLGQLLVASLLIHVLAITLLTGLIYLMFVYVFGLENISLWQFVRSPTTTVFFLYAVLTSLVLTTLRQINLLLGPGNLVRFIRGEFYHPHEEVMIFMFLDLRSSTALAERLGHIRYSQLIQDCFKDLRVVATYRARVYQYVGDEAVLIWNQAEGLANENCLRAFFAFEEQLQRRAPAYQASYGVVPSFKAGLNVGQVTVSEVGVMKREIAFHGDTINTAARIEGHCNNLGAPLLISDTLHRQLATAPDFIREKAGTIHLRGRQEAIDLYAIKKRVNPH